MEMYPLISSSPDSNLLIYNFISDRFRAIEKDFTILGSYGEEARESYQIMIRFYINMSYLLQNYQNYQNQNQRFDTKLLMTRLYNCLTNLFE
mmetsp:Transcript_3351/g.2800  ORF Transcript_3351/g.2800 Transcript_3351/m.2800 type:complete len:92 (+) Transcript_3351:260-535(+)